MKSKQSLGNIFKVLLAVTLIAYSAGLSIASDLSIPENQQIVFDASDDLYQQPGGPDSLSPRPVPNCANDESGPKKKKGPDCSTCGIPANTPDASESGTREESPSCGGGETSYGFSYINNITLSYTHYADDYRSAAVMGCASCGGGSGSSGNSLRLRRYFSSRNMVDVTAFGPGCATEYDVRLKFYKVGNATIVDYVDPRYYSAHRFVDGPYDHKYTPAGETARDGIFKPLAYNYARQIVLLEADKATVATDISTAKFARVEYFTGEKNLFQIVNLGNAAVPVDAANLQLHLKLNETAGAVAADASTYNRPGSVVGTPAWITDGKHAGAIDFTAADQRVKVAGYNGITGAAKRTVSFWVKTTATSGVLARFGENLAGGKNFEMRINSGEYGTQGALKIRTGNNPDAEHTIGDAVINDGVWHHVAVVLPEVAGTARTGDLRIYVDGILSMTSETLSGVINTGAGEVELGGFVGQLDDFRIYDTDLSDEQIISVAGIADIFTGRLKSMVARDGSSTEIRYHYFDADNGNNTAVNGSPMRKLQIATVTDRFGNQLQFSYADPDNAGEEKYVAGRWVVTKITLPNNQEITYKYSGDNGYLNEVVGIDGTSTFNRTFDAATQLTKIEISDVAADPGHRNKTVYLTNNAFVYGDPRSVVPQPVGLVRMVTDSQGKVVYAASADAGSVTDRYIYARGKLFYVDSKREVKYAKNWSLGAEKKFSREAIEANNPQWETKHAKFNYTTGAAWMRGEPTEYVSADGRVTETKFGSNSDPLLGQITRATVRDAAGNIVEDNREDRNSAGYVTKSTDRFGRQTVYEYDPANPTLLRYRKVGLVNDVQTAEYAVYETQYYGVGEVVDGETQPANKVKAEIDPLGNATKYVYYTNGLLWKILEPDDEGTGYHVRSTYVYNNAGQLYSSADAIGRTTKFFYDAKGRQVLTVYGDSSTEATVYENGLVKYSKDRNGVVTEYTYDSLDRQVAVKTGDFKIFGTINTPTDINTIVAASAFSITENANGIFTETTTEYIAGTNLVKSTSSNGEKNVYTYDYRQRNIARTTYPRADKSITTKTIYSNNERIATEDQNGVRSYSVYDEATGDYLRSIDEAFPNAVTSALGLADGAVPTQAQLRTLPRLTGENIAYSISESSREIKVAAGSTEDSYPGVDAGDIITKSADNRGVISVSKTDSRGRSVRSISTVSKLVGGSETLINDSKITGISESIYDAAGNVIRVNNPRFFDVTDANGYQKDYTLMTYTRRGLTKQRKVGFGVDDSNSANKVRGTETYTYYLDGQRKTVTDMRGAVTTYYYSPCCARLVFVMNALGHGSVQRTDAGGRSIFSASIPNVADFMTAAGGLETINGEQHPTLQMMKNLLKTDATYYDNALSMSTTKYDGLGRTVASTVWQDINNRPAWPEVNGKPNRLDVPIAGEGSIAASAGLTTRYIYDENVTDGEGLDSAAGVTVAGTNVKLSEMLSKLADQNINLNAVDSEGNVLSNGSASAVIGPDGSVSASISDGLGRGVISAQLNPNTSCAIMTHSIQLHDKTAELAGLGLVTVSQTLRPHAEDAGTIEYVSGKSYSDAFGRTLASDDELGNRSTFTYVTTNDPAVATQKVRDAAGNGSDVYTDERGRSVKTVDTTGATSTQTYNVAGMVLTSTDAKGNIAESKYDVRGRRIIAVDRMQYSTAFYYDVAGNLCRIVDADAGDPALGYEANATRKHTLYVYDLLGRKIATRYPDSDDEYEAGTFTNGADGQYDRIENQYDPTGKLARKTDQTGDYVTFEYDFAGRVKARHYFAANGTLRDSDSYNYAANGRLTSATKGRYANTVSYTYDAAGRRVSETLTADGNSRTTNYAYDFAGRNATLTYPDGTVVTREFTKRNQLAGVSYNSANVISRTYDAAGRLATTTYANGKVETRSYDRNDNLVTGINTPGVANFAYTYDANKNPETQTNADAAANSWSATYDNQDRLNAFNKSAYAAHNQTWQLTAVGDWTSTSRNGAVENRTFNAAHEVTSQSMQHSRRGNITRNANGQAYTWDQDNMLASADLDNDGTVDATYKYDILGRRVSKTVGSKTTLYAFAGNQVIAEYEKVGGQNSLKRKFVFASYVDSPKMMVTVTGTNEAKHYYHQNSNFNVIALTDAAGNIVEKYAYTAYGKADIFTPGADNQWNTADDVTVAPLAAGQLCGTTAGSGSNPAGHMAGTFTATSTVDNPYLFTGRRLDAESGLYYFRARYHDANLGRFISRDPMQYVDGHSLYAAYFGQHFGIDPSGKIEPVTTVAIVVGAVTVAATIATPFIHDWATGSSDISQGGNISGLSEKNDILNQMWRDDRSIDNQFFPRAERLSGIPFNTERMNKMGIKKLPLSAKCPKFDDSFEWATPSWNFNNNTKSLQGKGKITWSVEDNSVLGLEGMDNGSGNNLRGGWDDSTVVNGAAYVQTPLYTPCECMYSGVTVKIYYFSILFNDKYDTGTNEAKIYRGIIEINTQKEEQKIIQPLTASPLITVES